MIAANAAGIDVSFDHADQESPEFVYANSSSQGEDADKLAFIGARMIGATQTILQDPYYQARPAATAEKLEEVFQESLEMVNGNAGRLNDTVSAINSGIEIFGDGLKAVGDHVKIDGVKIGSIPYPERSLKWAVRKSSEFFKEDGTLPQFDHKVRVGLNTWVLKEAQTNSAVAPYLRRATQQYAKDLNLQDGISNNPVVMRAAVEREARIQIANIKALTGKNQAELKVLFRNAKTSPTGRTNFNTFVKDLDEKVNAAADRANAPVIRLLEEAKQREVDAENAAIQADQKRQEASALEAARVEIASSFGVASGLLALAGYEDGADHVQHLGRFFDAAYRAITQSGGASPMTFLNPYVTAITLGAGLFGPHKKTAHEQILGLFEKTHLKLDELRKQIYELGVQMNRRFDTIDQVLRRHAAEATRAFGQMNATGSYTNQQLTVLTDLMKLTQQQTYRTQIMASSGKWLELKERCFNGSQPLRLDKRGFRSCLQGLEDWALKARVEADGEANIQSAVEALVPILTREGALSPNPISAAPQPGAWLAATTMVLRLAKEHPEHRSILATEAADSVVGIGLDQLIEGGAYYQNLIRTLAVTSQSSLRRSVFDHAIARYETAVEDTLEFVKKTPNRILPGMPDLRGDWYKEVPSETSEQSLYPFLLEPVRFCAKDGKIAWNVGRIFPEASKMMQESFDKHPQDLRWPPGVIKLLPAYVRRAVASDLTRDHRMNLKVDACLHAVDVDTRGESSDLHLEADLRMAYHNDEGQKRLVVINRVIIFQSVDYAQFLFQDDNRNPLAAAWNGTPPFRPELSIWARTANEKHGFIGILPKDDDSIFWNDLERVYRSAGLQIQKEVEQGLPVFNQQTKRALDEMILIVTRGLEVNQDSVARLREYVTQPLNLPLASEWAETFMSTKVSAGQLRRELRKRLTYLRKLVDNVQASEGLRPGRDLFGPRLTELRYMRDEAARPKPWYRKLFW